MRVNRWLLTLLLSVLCKFALSETFVVTTNSNSGAGSLREALQKASDNGTASFDTIVFNIPGSSMAERTILLTGPLTLTSKLVIDGTSQPGSPFGVSDTKIIIQRAADICTAMYMQDVSDVEIYGLWFKNFNYWIPLNADCGAFTIVINGAKRLTIGKLNKGNAFSNNSSNSVFHKSYYGINWQNPTAFADTVLVEGNVFGLRADATGIDVNIREGVALNNGKNVIINRNYGNCIFSVGSVTENGNGFVRFTDNNLSNPFNPTEYCTWSGFAITKQGLTSQYVSYDLQVTGNKITNKEQYCIILWDMQGKIRVENNELGAYHNRTLQPEDSYGLAMIRCKPASSAIVMHNKIMNRKFGIYLSEAGRAFISNNSIYCNKKGIHNYLQQLNVPTLSLKEIAPPAIVGKTIPNGRVELFYTDTCTQFCENGRTLIGTVVADANGNFSYPVSAPGLYSGTVTNADSITSEFNGIKVDTGLARIKNATCGFNNGSVTGIVIRNASSWHWEDSTGQIISTDTNLVNVGPGKYRLVLHEVNVSCPIITRYFEVLAYPPPVLSGNPFVLTHPSCGLNNGKVKVTAPRPPGAVSAWLNSAGTVLAQNTDSIQNLLPGQYFYKLYLFQDSTCPSTYGPFELVNQSGPSLNTNNAQVTHATCGLNNGSIKNITANNTTGTAVYRWVDSLNRVVSTSADLLNAAPGKYRLKFKDGSACDTIFTAFYTIQSLDIINIDTSQLTVTSSQCAYASGTITGVNVTGANEYKWYNQSGQLVSQQLNPGFVYAGKYVLVASNQYGCTKTSDSITVPVYPFFPIPANAGFRIEGRPGTCDSANGYVRAINFPNPQLYTFRWVDSTNENAVLSTTLELTGIRSGTFYMYAKNANNCEQKVLTARLVATPAPRIDESRAQVVHDACGQRAGNITGIVMTQGFGAPPYRYQWLDENNALMDTLPDIMRLPAGKYRLQVTDRFGCTVTSKEYVVLNNQLQLPKPQYDDQLIPRNTGTRLIIKNLTAGGWYQLYDAPVNGNMLAQSLTGQFETGQVSADKTFYVQYVVGNCTSGFTAVNIRVFDNTKIVVPNAFSPNGDGINDVWLIKTEGLVQSLSVYVFNRYGQRVYERTELNGGWDGRKNGHDLPTATYYWVLEAIDHSGKRIRMNGSVTLLR